MSNFSFITVSNRLPISITKEDGKLTFSPSSGGLATAMSSLGGDGAKLWIGWPGIASDDLTPADKRLITRKLRELDCAPVFLTQKQISEYYDGYANSTIWPLFHYFHNRTEYNPDYWEAYRRINALFQKAVVRYATPDATVWVHDYHLMLLPEMLKRTMPGTAIGFFLHIPFPSFEIFRLLPNGAEVLRGLLGADLVGFHTYDYTRHFLSSVRQTLGYESENGSILMRHRTVKTDAFPIGIDYQKFVDALELPAVKAEMAQLKKHYAGQRLIISVDRLDYSKGITARLEAYGKFLEQNPAYHKKVTLIVVAVPSRTDVNAYRQLRDTIELTVSRINGTYATMNWSPIAYQYANLPFEQVVALYAVAEVALVTPLRDGMNLVAKEYLAAKQKRPGVLILSEMAGAASELPEALRINPYDASAIVAALKRALKMPVAEQMRALHTMQARISQYSVIRWSKDFMEQLAAAKAETAHYQELRLPPATRQDVINSYAKAKKRLFLLDYDGTIHGFVSSPLPSDAQPSPPLLRLLSKLASDPRNKVCIISGRTRIALETWFKTLPVTLVAEHGAWFRDNGQWAQADLDFHDAKDKIRPILAHYAERTPGAVIEEKDFAMVWHYRNVIHELAYLRNSNLKHDLTLVLKDADVGIYEGDKILEIKPRSLHKGSLVNELVAEYPADFIFAAGDDYTDEDMFEVLPETAWTFKLGISSTQARYRIGSVDDVIDLLTALSKS